MRKKINKYDIGLIVVIVLINLFILFYGSNNMVQAAEKIAYVYSNNELVGRYTLTEDYEKEFKVQDKEGSGYNTVHIEDGRIWIHEATCPDQVCLHQGKIQNDGEVIVCLPNRFMIQIKGSNDDTDNLDDIDIIAQ
ncbi:NusG domain II-containing protein [Sedimentibacter sp.]|uniref:NusG domain II-containing protein n=1 Tax=Sedimentibacter sp. TaxID=1960295 RepID=UPI0028A5FC63|nr:NusG domain II-containing protein [Sedimentibacter sp.]